MTATQTTSKAPSLVFTDSAASKVAALIHEEGNFDLKLRVYIQGGGCSGFQYGFSFDETQADDDTVIQKNVALQEDEDDQHGSGTTDVAVKLLVDPMSYQYLMGAEIDYREDVSGAQFVIRNPNAKTTCGCGSSFSA